MGFQNFTVAGQQLAARLTAYQAPDTQVITTSANGSIIASEVALALHLPLDILVVRKLKAPGHPGRIMGVVAPNGVRILDRDLIEELQIPANEIERVSGWERSEVQRRLARYRADMPPPNVAGQTVLVIDEGMNTGMSMWAAVRALGKLSPSRIIVGVPVASQGAVDLLVDNEVEVIALAIPEPFVSVEAGYNHYRQVHDQELIDTLQKAREYPLTTNSPTG